MFPSTSRTRRKLIMHRLASASTSLLFAAHVMLGCCAHHAHGHGGEAVYGHAVVAGQWSCGDRCDGHAANESFSHDADDCAGGACAHGWCTYVRSEDKPLHRDGSPTPGSAIFVPSAPDAPTVGCHAAELLTATIAAAHPAHLFLLHCALLI